MHINNDLKAVVTRHCLEEGFANVRFSRAERLNSERQLLREWLGAGHQAGMKWMEESSGKRTDPFEIMENVRTIISLSYTYDTPYEHHRDDNIPKISRYAWGSRDYHKIIKKKLKNLCRKLSSLETDIEVKAYVDDGPVMDKAWAARSGLGWMGKHTNIIDKEIGSFFFIATILTNIDLEPDRPVEDLCRDCTLCMTACPTGAIYDDYKLDANLCISYHTIENRSETIDNIKLYGWVFGCDICQDVCPFNRPGTFSSDEHFIPDSMVFGKSYDELLSMNEAEFRETFTGKPVMRTKYSGWIRNLRKALGEIT